MEHALLDDLAVQLRHAVDGMAHIAADVGHAHLAVAQNGHVVDLALVAGEGALQVGAAAVVQLHADLVNARQRLFKNILVPLSSASLMTVWLV